jgi:hypothetical protein
MSEASNDPMTFVRAIDNEIPHVWMIRTFLKHADEAEDDDDLRDIVRDLYDFILAVGPLEEVEDPAVYLKMAKKKLGKLKRATSLYEEIQPEVSGHTNFVMAARSLRTAVDRIEAIVSSL